MFSYRVPIVGLAVGLLFAMMDGLQVQWLYEPEHIAMAHLFEQFLKLFREQ